MKRATMVTLEIHNIKKIRELGLNLSQLIDTLLTKYIAECELDTDKTRHDKNYMDNKAKSEEAWEKRKKELADKTVYGDDSG
jgi:antitoxin component of RelBE/YafQ-DinJ toxin-antitoxin module